MTDKKSTKTDPDGINKDRAAWTQAALTAFQAETGTEDEEALKDLLCDLMHLSGPDAFDAALLAARWHFKYETSDELKGDVLSQPDEPIRFRNYYRCPNDGTE